MDDLIECRKCGELCQVDGEFPKFVAWCDTCNDYADYDMSEYAADYLATKVDAAHERQREEEME